MHDKCGPRMIRVNTNSKCCCAAGVTAAAAASGVAASVGAAAAAALASPIASFLQYVSVARTANNTSRLIRNCIKFDCDLTNFIISRILFSSAGVNRLME